MTRLSALRRAMAFDQGRGIARASRRHVQLTDTPLVISLHCVAGEPFAPWALVWGIDPQRPAGSVLIPEPRDRTSRYQVLTRFAEGLCAYVAEHLAYDLVRTPRSGKLVPVTRSAPQIVVPTRSAASALTRVAGRGVPRVDSIPPVLLWASTHLRWFEQDVRETDGQSLLVPAASALAEHWSTGQAGIEDENLPSVLAWLTSRGKTRDARLADIAAAEKQTWGDQRDPDRDQLLMTLVGRYNDTDDPAARQAAVRDIEGEVLPTLVDAYRGTHQALALLRTLPEGPSVAERWADDKRAWARHAQRCDTTELPLFAARDSPQVAMRRSAVMEHARARYAAQTVFDDVLLMAEIIENGRAVSGEVVHVDTSNREIRHGRTQARKTPIVTLRTRFPPRLPANESVWWTAVRTVHGQVRRHAPAARRPTDLPIDEPHTIEIALLSGHDHGRTVPAIGSTVTFAAIDPRPSNPVRPATPVPWTHQSPSQDRP
jgi:hypothetical protein